MKPPRHELREALRATTAHACCALPSSLPESRGRDLYSWNKAGLADALRLLAVMGEVEIVEERGNHLWANWVEREGDHDLA